jgi:Rieske Fe-S protein
MADLAHQHIPDARPGETGRDVAPYGCRACPRRGSIYDERGRVFRSPAPPSLAVPTDALAGGTTIKIG